VLRVLVALLLLANLVFFGWSRSWFAPAWPPPRAGEHEPERLRAQIAPERITVLTAQAASAAVASALRPPACLEAGPMAEAEVGPAEAALTQAGLAAESWTREAHAPPEAAAPAASRNRAKTPAPPPAPALWWLRFAAADAELQARLQALPAPAPGGGFRPCASPP
jgi:hypothetical protein